MYQFVISPSAVSTNPFLQSFLKQFDKIQKQGVRLYYTYIETDPHDVGGEKEKLDNMPFTFVTTSKDIHLGLGRLCWDAQSYLVGLLEHEFEKDEYMSQMLLYLEKAILVTRTEEIDGTVVYTFSPAH